MTGSSFSDQVLNWFEKNGRHDLPWQANQSLYTVWLSEIMLQQTQVATVKPYFEKFMQHFPKLEDLANATLDDVLVLWAGLGYYTRARNLHKTAMIIQQEYGNAFPEKFEEVLALPGIGRSTAGAILAQASGQRHAILDGNVKRVLSRYFAIEGWSGKRAVEMELWKKAEECTPDQQLADYTQAMMDLGATICKRSSPSCDICPLLSDCKAHATGRVAELPTSRPKKVLPVKATRMLLITNESGAVMLEKRPPSGIWGGLWSLPEADIDEQVEEVCQKRWGLSINDKTDSESFRHTFSHYHLDITACRVSLNPDQVMSAGSVSEKRPVDWCMPSRASERGLAAPVARLLQSA